MAKLYGVGVGSGDPELLTLKAIRVIRESDVIAVPTENVKESVAYNIVRQVLPKLEDMEVTGIAMPMIKDKEALKLAHKQSAERLTSYLAQGKNVAFLTLGDPTIFSTFMYLKELVEKEGYETELVNGIASFLAAAARLNTSLVLRDEKLHIIPSTYSVEYAMLLDGTKVFMKAGKQMAKLKSMISESGQKAFFIENCGMENERVITEMEKMPEEAGYYSLVIVFDKK